MSDDFNKSPIYQSPSFLRGLARLVDFSGEIDQYNTSSDPDTNALQEDWKAVGNDLKVALKRYSDDRKTATR
jgi:hypothetical protein